MARRAQPLALRLAAGLAVALVAALVFGTLAAVALRAEGPARLDRADWAAVRFTLVQAALSALVSTLLAVPAARALSRRRFPGRRALIAALGAPFLLPVIVAILGLLAVFGRQGPVNAALIALGLPPVSIYGLGGVVLAHVFFNLPLATRMILQGWNRIPAETFRLAASLGLDDRRLMLVVEWPMLKTRLPDAFLVVFLLCLTSFATVLALGGGPRATTIELAIYQAFRFDFDLGRAAALGLVQVAIGLAAAALALGVRQPPAAAGLDRQVARWDGAGWRRGADALLLIAVAAFLALPLAQVVLRGLPGLAELPAGLAAPALRSLAVALAATALALALALPLALSVAAAEGSAAARLAEALGSISVAASPLVLGTGLYLILYPVADPVAWALPLTALVNALMALPFALRVLVPAAVETHRRFDRLAQSLDLAGWRRLRLVTLPRLRAPLGFAAGLAAALSAGDLGVVALFADPAQATLPLQVYALMGAYRMQAAAAAALILVALTFGLFRLFDALGGDAAA